MRCPACAQENRDGARFCDACAAPLPSLCPACGTTNRAGARFCSECAAPLGAPEPLPTPLVAHPVGPSLHQPLSPDGERRQLTVMFCDLADSTTLSQRLDPEDLRTLLRRFQHTCAETVAAFGGHVAHYMGDGLLVYFGYPQAQEDDPRRAVRCGLAIVDAVGRLSGQLAAERGISLAVRAGIHTGLVVLGEMGSGERVEPADVVGETPNIAARLQGLAAPNTVVLSAATARLVQGFFHTETLGHQTLKGIAQPLPLYRVLAETGAAGRLEVAASLTPLVGREREVALLLDRWRQATTGRMQVVVLSGEAGIGKSRLVRVLRERIETEPHLRVELRCSQFHQNSALYPLIDHYQRFLGFAAQDTTEAKLARLEAALRADGLAPAETVALFAALLSLPLPERYTVPALSPERLKQQTYAAALAWLRAVARRQPVLLIVEDLHWVDPSTLEFLSLTLEQTTDLPLLALLTCRPEFTPPWPPEANLTVLTLTRLDREQAREVVTRVAGGTALPGEVVAQIVARTDGVPLFVEELTRMVLESELLVEHEGRYELTGPLPPLAIPSTLHDSLMARLDRLAAVKEVAQLGATLGREFSYELLQAVARLDERALQPALAQLVAAGLVFQRGVPPTARYVFKHALIQDAAYESLLRSRRQQLHQQIAQVLEERFPETVEVQPELLAHHYTEAGFGERAIVHWQRAGTRAAERSAHVEAVAHLSRGLELLHQLPDAAERAEQELDLQLSLGTSIIASKGLAAPEVEQSLTRARELCRQIGETPQLFQALRGLWYFCVLRKELQTARELAEQLLTLAQQIGDPALLLEAHYALANTLNYAGEFAAAQAHLAQGIALYDPQQHRDHAYRYGLDPGVACRALAGATLWWLGYPDQGLQRSHEALALARETAHPHSLAFALFYAATVHHFRREAQPTQEHAEAAIALSTEQRFPLWEAGCTIYRGWALAEGTSDPSAGWRQGQVEEGIAQMQQGLDAWHATGAVAFRSYVLALLAEASSKEGQPEAGLTLLAEALALTRDTGERRWDAELHRLRGEVLLARSADHAAEAEACFRQSLDIARRQQAKSYELRTATRLSRLWQQQGRLADARQLLAEVYGWFTEGFDTRDLREAKALLDELA